MDLWDVACKEKSNIDIIRKFLNKVLGNIVNALWYIRTLLQSFVTKAGMMVVSDLRMIHDMLARSWRGYLTSK